MGALLVPGEATSRARPAERRPGRPRTLRATLRGVVQSAGLDTMKISRLSGAPSASLRRVLRSHLDLRLDEAFGLASVLELRVEDLFHLGSSPHSEGKL